jgi:HSP20 family protein
VGSAPFSAMGDRMRYRRLTYRYSVVLTHGEPRQLGETDGSTFSGVRFAQTRWRPPADIYETPSAIRVTVELAGVDPDELDLAVYENAVVVEGQRHLPPADAAGVYHAVQIRRGPYRLELALPARIDPERAKVHSDRGLLHLTFAKATEGR